MTDPYLFTKTLAKSTRTAALAGSVCAALWAGACSSVSSHESVGSSHQALLGDGLVISQVFGAGGNAKSPLAEDFVELFNRTDSPISLDGLSLQYANAAGDFGTAPADGGAETFITVLPSVSVGAGQYFLVGMASNTVGSGVALPTPDFVGPTDLAPQNGKIALVRGTTAVGCGAAANRCAATDVVDLVGYGTATDYAGSAAVPALSATTAALRNGAGCADTGQNAADFTVTTPAPRNSATAVHSCDSGSDAGEGGVIVLLDSSSPSGDGGGVTTEDGGISSDDASANDGGQQQLDATANDASESDGGGAQDATVGDDGGGSDAAPSPLVISQVFGGGGNAGSPYASDFVELFNRSSASVSLAGMAVQYADKAMAFEADLNDGAPADNIVPLPSVTLVPGEYFLVGLGTKGVGTGAALPTPDVTGTINLAAGAGKVALTTVTTALGCGTAANRCAQTNIVDLVGYGASTDYEGSGPVGALTKTTAALRNGNGCVDTRDNASDFTVVAPAPRNSATALFVCGSASNDAGSGGGTGGGTKDAGGGMDAGTTMSEDSGATSEDSGAIATEDSGALSDDAGVATSEDAGVPASDDAGVSVAGGGSSGCSCSTIGGEHVRSDWTAAMGTALFLGSVAGRRRRNRCATRGDRQA